MLKDFRQFFQTYFFQKSELKFTLMVWFNHNFIKKNLVFAFDPLSLD